jgi:type II secretory pathway component GspD/PulD (secretin)
MSIHKFCSAILIIGAVLLIGGFLAVAQIPKAQDRQPSAKSDQKMMIDPENHDLRIFINVVADAIGLTPIEIDPAIQGTVEVVTATPVSKDAVFPLFSNVLKCNDAVLIRDRGNYKVLPMSAISTLGKVEIITNDKLPEEFSAQKSQPKQSPQTIGDQKQSGSSQKLSSPKTQGTGKRTSGTPSASAKNVVDSVNPRMATYIGQVNTIPVKDLIEAIKPHITNAGCIMPYEPLNMVIFASNDDSVAMISHTISVLNSMRLDAQIPQAQDQQPSADDVGQQLQDMLRRRGEGTSNPSAASTSPIPPPSISSQVIIKHPCDDNDLRTFINQFAAALGITPLVIDEDVKGTCGVESMPPMSKDDAFSLFIIVLKQNNAALTKDKGIYQVISIAKPMHPPVPIIEKLPDISTPTTPPKKLPANTGSQK